MGTCPWLDPEPYYEGFNGKQILILGESFHCNEGCPKNHCNNNVACFGNIVKEFQKRSLGECKYQPTYSNIAKLLCDFFNIEEKDLWKKLAFHDYVNYSVAPNAGVSPDVNDWINCYPYFVSLINQIKPDIVICLGERLWNHLPKYANNWNWSKSSKLGENNPNIDQTILSTTSIDTYNYDLGEKQIKFIWVYHPSRKEFKDHYNNYLILLNDLFP